MRGELDALDVLVNNAAIHYDTWERALTADLGVVREALETNTLGPWRMAIAFADLLRASAHGRLVNVSSGAGALTGMRDGAPAYSVSKAALNALTLMLADALARDGVLVNAVCPGWVATDMGGAGGRPVRGRRGRHRVGGHAPGRRADRRLLPRRPADRLVGAGRGIAPSADAGEDRRAAGELRRAERVVERDDAGQRADQRLEVDERARELGGHARLRPGEQPEGERRAGEREREHRDDRAAAAVGAGGAPSNDDRERQRGDAAGGELDRGDRGGVAAGAAAPAG